MVEFEEIKDEDYSDTDAVVYGEDVWSDESSDDESSDDDDDEVDIANETLFDRIAALKDIIPAPWRDTIARTFSKAYSCGRVATYIGGKAVCMVVTLTFLIAVPLKIFTDAEEQELQWENQLQTQQTMNNVPSPQPS
jgi:mitochondrial import receptor subunit TOM22